VTSWQLASLLVLDATSGTLPYAGTVENVPWSPQRAMVGVAAGLALALVAVSGAGAAGTTTGTELIVPMRATLTKSGGLHLSASPRVELETTILFLVTNRSAKRRWFEIGTRTTELRRTPLMRPGATERFYYVFRVRGTTPFRWGGPGAKPRRGVLRVV